MQRILDQLFDNFRNREPVLIQLRCVERQHRNSKRGAGGIYDMDPAAFIFPFEKLPSQNGALVGSGNFGGHGDDDDVFPVGKAPVIVQKGLRAWLDGFGSLWCNF